MKLKDKTPCVCGHTQDSHSFTKKAPGCVTCGCLCYRNSNLSTPSNSRPRYVVELVGLPNGWKPVTPAEMNYRYRQEMIAQRPTILARKIERDERYLAQAETAIMRATASIHEAKAELESLNIGELQVAA